MQGEYWILKHEPKDELTKRAANEFLLSMKLAKKAPASVDKYRRVIERFLQDCKKPLEELTSEDVLDWLNAYCDDKAVKTKELVLYVLSSFFRFCLTEEYIDKVLVKSRWRPKIPRTLPKFLTGAELAKVKLQAEKLSLRDRAIVEFLLSSGCRRGEVAGLNVNDVDLENRTAVVLGKGSKLREVHFSIECALLLTEYLENHPKDTEAVFINKYGKRLTPYYIFKIVSNLGKMAGLEESLSPHCCRHTFATNLLAKGAELEFIGDELGHNDLNTTRVYASIPSEDIISEYKKRMG